MNRAAAPALQPYVAGKMLIDDEGQARFVPLRTIIHAASPEHALAQAKARNLRAPVVAPAPKESK